MLPPLHNYIVRRCSASPSSTATVSLPPKLAAKTHPHRLPDRAGTTVLLVHNGEPRTNFYARTYLGRAFVDRLRLPKWAGTLVADFYFACSSFPARCISDSVHFAQNADQLRWLKNRLNAALSLLLPEFGPFRCLPATAQEDQTNVEPQLQGALRHGMNNLLLFPLQQQWRTGPLLSSLKIGIAGLADQTKQQNGTKEEDSQPKHQQCEEEGKDGFVCSAQHQFVVRNSSVPFSLLIADAQIAWTTSFVQYWVERILPLFAHYRVIIFMAARSTPIDQLEHAARRVMYAIYRHSPLATPWRCAVHYTWDQPFGHWVDRLALMRWRRHTLARCVHRLRKKGVAGPFLVVPLDSMLECFDTHTTLPALVASLNAKSRSMVHLLPTKPLTEDDALVHSLAECVKYVMLNPQEFCFSTDETIDE